MPAQFSIAAIKSCHKLRGLKNTHLLSQFFWAKSPSTVGLSCFLCSVSHKTKIKSSLATFLSLRSREEYTSNQFTLLTTLSSLKSKTDPHFLSGCHLGTDYVQRSPQSMSAALSISEQATTFATHLLDLPAYCISPDFCFISLIFFFPRCFQGLIKLDWAYLNNPDHSPYCKVLNIYYVCKFPLPYKALYSQLP